MKIPITRPVFDAADRAALLQPLETGWVVQGPNVAAFEKTFGEFTACKHSIATTSCTTALHLALAALDIGPKDAVIVPSFTYVASANAVEYTGARPVLCDIDLSTFNIDIRQFREILKHPPAGCRFKAVMPVHLFGLSAEMNDIQTIAREHDLRIVEDAACALGTFYHGRHIGSLGDAGCFSFHPRKAITTGEGGMVTVSDDALAARIRSLRDHGASSSDLERHMKEGGSLLPQFNMLGYNYRMTDFQGALGVTQMAKAKDILSGRLAAVQKYEQMLGKIPWLIRPTVPSGMVHSFQSYVCRINEESFDRSVGTANRFRNRLMKELEAAGISVRQGTHAVHTLGYYQKKYGYQDNDLPNAFRADRLSITLPVYHGMTSEEQSYVLDHLETSGASVLKTLRDPTH